MSHSLEYMEKQHPKTVTTNGGLKIVNMRQRHYIFIYIKYYDPLSLFKYVSHFKLSSEMNNYTVFTSAKGIHRTYVYMACR